ncbi:MAG: hypothetical protein GTO60_01950, partial [Gammaproteobacteria bacterium]|nr:hypothetical protein [Gammaproteobacteria bacterium]
GGATPLWVAVYSGNTEMVVRLLESGANPNISLSSGETSLMTAAENGKLDIVQSLLSAGADVNA